MNPSTPSRTGTTASAGAWGITTPPTKTPRKQAEQMLARAGRELAPKLLHSYAAAVWEDQDECLEVRPEDVAI